MTCRYPSAVLLEINAHSLFSKVRRVRTAISGCMKELMDDCMAAVVFREWKARDEALPANPGAGGGRGITHLRIDRWDCVSKQIASVEY